MTKIDISVLVIAYNQEDYIETALKSAVLQSHAPYEVVVCDDHSSDGTWDIICRYNKEYPHLIKAHRNEANLGIYGNYEKTKALCTGNVVCWLGGDDYYELTALEILSEEIVANHLDPDKDRFIVVTNNYLFYPSGATKNWDNYPLRNTNPIKSRIRGDLSFRSFGFSKLLLDAIPSTVSMQREMPDIGYGVDTIKGLEEILNCEKIVFCNKFTSYYRLGVGATSDDLSSIRAERILALYPKIVDKYSTLWDEDDLKYFDFMQKASKFALSQSFARFIVAGVSYLENINNFGYNANRINHLKYLLPSWSTKYVKRAYISFMGFFRK